MNGSVVRDIFCMDVPFCIVFQTELYQLPAPLFETTDAHTRAVLFAHRAFRNMDSQGLDSQDSQGQSKYVEKME